MGWAARSGGPDLSKHKSHRSALQVPLAFATDELEESFLRRRSTALIPQDVSWAAFGLAFALGGLIKWLRYEGKQAAELPAILAYTACCPVLLCIIHLWPAFYVRNRTAVLLAVRVARTVLMIANLKQWEGVYMGHPAGTTPTGTFKLLHHFAWKVLSMWATGMSWVMPFRVHAPWLALFLGLQLHATAQRCRTECGGFGGGAQLAASVLHGMCAPAAGPGTCSPGDAAAGAGRVEHLYGAAVRLLQLTVPPGWRVAADDGCLHGCYAVHAWLQAAFGVLLPLALVWGYEERLRVRELVAWRAQVEEERGGATLAPRACAPSPLPACVLAAWCLASSWLLWLLVQATLLQA